MSKYKNKLGQTFDTVELTEMETFQHRIDVIEDGVFNETSISTSLFTKDFAAFRTDMYKLRFPEKVWTKETTSLMPFYNIN